ncbi:unnamed protein product [Amoebophrya sp. A120]|nr:unnamed protein product [Amoebophrya sp. A120]|eukprot:GSA120T00023761001.1
MNTSHRSSLGGTFSGPRQLQESNRLRCETDVEAHFCSPAGGAAARATPTAGPTVSTRTGSENPNASKEAGDDSAPRPPSNALLRTYAPAELATYWTRQRLFSSLIRRLQTGGRETIFFCNMPSNGHQIAGRLSYTANSNPYIAALSGKSGDWRANFLGGLAAALFPANRPIDGAAACGRGRCSSSSTSAASVSAFHQLGPSEQTEAPGGASAAPAPFQPLPHIEISCQGLKDEVGMGTSTTATGNGTASRTSTSGRTASAPAAAHHSQQGAQLDDLLRGSYPESFTDVHSGLWKGKALPRKRVAVHRREEFLEAVLPRIILDKAVASTNENENDEFTGTSSDNFYSAIALRVFVTSEDSSGVVATTLPVGNSSNRAPTGQHQQAQPLRDEPDSARSRQRDAQQEELHPGAAPGPQVQVTNRKTGVLTCLFLNGRKNDFQSDPHLQALLSELAGGDCAGRTNRTGHLVQGRTSKAAAPSTTSSFSSISAHVKRKTELNHFIAETLLLTNEQHVSHRNNSTIGQRVAGNFSSSSSSPASSSADVAGVGAAAGSSNKADLDFTASYALASARSSRRSLGLLADQQHGGSFSASAEMSCGSEQAEAPLSYKIRIVLGCEAGDDPASATHDGSALSRGKLNHSEHQNFLWCKRIATSLATLGPEAALRDITIKKCDTTSTLTAGATSAFRPGMPPKSGNRATSTVEAASQKEITATAGEQRQEQDENYKTNGGTGGGAGFFSVPGVPDREQIRHLLWSAASQYGATSNITVNREDAPTSTSGSAVASCGGRHTHTHTAAAGGGGGPPQKAYPFAPTLTRRRASTVSSLNSVTNIKVDTVVAAVGAKLQKKLDEAKAAILLEDEKLVLQEEMEELRLDVLLRGSSSPPGGVDAPGDEVPVASSGFARPGGPVLKVVKQQDQKNAKQILGGDVIGSREKRIKSDFSSHTQSFVCHSSKPERLDNLREQVDKRRRLCDQAERLHEAIVNGSSATDAEFFRAEDLLEGDDSNGDHRPPEVKRVGITEDEDEELHLYHNPTTLSSLERNVDALDSLVTKCLDENKSKSTKGGTSPTTTPVVLFQERVAKVVAAMQACELRQMKQMSLEAAEYQGAGGGGDDLDFIYIGTNDHRETTANFRRENVDLNKKCSSSCEKSSTSYDNWKISVFGDAIKKHDYVPMELRQQLAVVNISGADEEEKLLQEAMDNSTETTPNPQRQQDQTFAKPVKTIKRRFLAQQDRKTSDRELVQHLIHHLPPDTGISDATFAHLKAPNLSELHYATVLEPGSWHSLERFAFVCAAHADTLERLVISGNGAIAETLKVILPLFGENLKCLELVFEFECQVEDFCSELEKSMLMTLGSKKQQVGAPLPSVLSREGHVKTTVRVSVRRGRGAVQGSSINTRSTRAAGGTSARNYQQTRGGHDLLRTDRAQFQLPPKLIIGTVCGRKINKRQYDEAELLAQQTAAGTKTDFHNIDSPRSSCKSQAQRRTLSPAVIAKLIRTILHSHKTLEHLAVDESLTSEALLRLCQEVVQVVKLQPNEDKGRRTSAAGIQPPAAPNKQKKDVKKKTRRARPEPPFAGELRILEFDQSVLSFQAVGMFLRTILGGGSGNSQQVLGDGDHDRQILFPALEFFHVSIPKLHNDENFDADEFFSEDQVQDKVNTKKDTTTSALVTSNLPTSLAQLCREAAKVMAQERKKEINIPGVLMSMEKIMS